MTHRIPAAEASAAQLRAFLHVQTGVDPAPTMNRDTVIAKLADAGVDVEKMETIPDFTAAMAPSSASRGRGVNGAPPEGAKFASIMVHTTDDRFAEAFVTVQVNGRIYQINRGVDAVVPIGVWHALNNAKEGVSLFDEKGRASGFRDTHRFPFSTNGFFFDDEEAAQARTAA